MELLNILWNLMFFTSIVYIINILIDLGFKIYGKFYLGEDNIQFTITKTEKIILWFSIAWVLTYVLI